MKIAESKYWYLIKSKVPKRYWDDMLDIFYRIRSLKYKGKDKECPICGHRHSNFIGNDCPRCDSSGRHRLLWLYLNRKTDLFTREGIRFLHFAPEFCLSKRFKKAENIDYLSTDLYSQRAMLKADIADLPLPDNHFDVVISMAVLMHVEDDVAALKELYRVQKPGGWSIHTVDIHEDVEKTFSDPTLDADGRLRVYGHFDQKRAYGRDYREILEQYGFEVEEISVDNFTTKEEQERYKLPKDFVIYLSRKKVGKSTRNGKPEATVIRN